MHTESKKLLLALIAVLATTLAVGTANANTITAEPAGGITATSEGRVRFSGRGGIEINIECRFTLRGEVNRTIDNVRGGQVGTITEGRANECGAFNAVFVLTATAWRMGLAEPARLEGAPDLINVEVTDFQFGFMVIGVRCLWAGLVPMRLETEGTPAVTRRIRILANTLSGLGSELCPREGSLTGEFRLTTQSLRL